MSTCSAPTSLRRGGGGSPHAGRPGQPQAGGLVAEDASVPRALGEALPLCPAQLQGAVFSDPAPCFLCLRGYDRSSLCPRDRYGCLARAWGRHHRPASPAPPRAQWFWGSAQLLSCLGDPTCPGRCARDCWAHSRAPLGFMDSGGGPQAWALWVLGGGDLGLRDAGGPSEPAQASLCIWPGDLPPLVLSPSQYHNYTQPRGNFIPYANEERREYR